MCTGGSSVFAQPIMPSLSHTWNTHQTLLQGVPEEHQAPPFSSQVPHWVLLADSPLFPHLLDLPNQTPPLHHQGNPLLPLSSGRHGGWESSWTSPCIIHYTMYDSHLALILHPCMLAGYKEDQGSDKPVPEATQEYAGSDTGPWPATAEHAILLLSLRVAHTAKHSQPWVGII